MMHKCMPYEAKPPVENLANCGGGNNPSSGNYGAPPSFIYSWPLSPIFYGNLIKSFSQSQHGHRESE